MTVSNSTVLAAQAGKSSGKARHLSLLVTAIPGFTDDCILRSASGEDPSSAESEREGEDLQSRRGASAMDDGQSRLLKFVDSGFEADTSLRICILRFIVVVVARDLRSVVVVHSRGRAPWWSLSFHLLCPSLYRAWSINLCRTTPEDYSWEIQHALWDNWKWPVVTMSSQQQKGWPFTMTAEILALELRPARRILMMWLSSTWRIFN